ncbi:methyltransferase domain-containing protein [Phyllobacterium meliloti]|uniref:methyltransferase domain-containing protein n=1 Tax=Phyllobacterium meliloti TaxID=555317 RepID=UPI001D158BB5|nr:methyltransferase domain-containing protein [Phyllobacterium sp. T1293]UGX87682.1 methyltransferase domain-containing protein [Phyllobacterium sp. T1293]
MHDTARRAGAAFLNSYVDPAQKVRLLDVGAMDVNGSLRSAAPSAVEYVGVDLEAGPGVDIVYNIGDPLPVEDNSFDLCVSTSCFEHDPLFWQTFLNVVDALKDGGYFYLNAPSNGPYHTFPTDNWRFYPDAGIALVKWARLNGRDIDLVESGTLKRDGDVWNDFIAVFKKADGSPAVRDSYLLDEFSGATNVRRGGEADVTNLDSYGEDALIAHSLGSQVENLNTASHQLKAELEEVTQAAHKLESDLINAQSLLSKLATNAKQEKVRADDLQLKITSETERANSSEARVQALSSDLEAISRDLEAMSLSTSWRLTSPLRKMVNIFRT